MRSAFLTLMMLTPKDAFLTLIRLILIPDGLNSCSHCLLKHMISKHRSRLIQRNENKQKKQAEKAYQSRYNRASQLLISVDYQY